MARPKNPDSVPAKKLEDIDVSDIPETNPENDTIAQLVEKANVYLGEKAEVLGRIGEVRELLTLLTNQGLGSPDQVQWVRFYLPRKTRKTGDEDENDVESADEVEAVEETAAA